MTEELKLVNINDINLDLENPRVPLSIRRQDSTKSSDEVNQDILEYLIKTSSLTELMLSIGENGFFSGEALLLIKDPGDTEKYIVIEGNRRVSALKLLHNPELATISVNKIKEASELAEEKPVKIPSIVFSNRDEILKYLGYRHITGIKNWKALEKARYMHTMYQKIKQPSIEDNDVYQEIAKSIGSQRSYVKRILEAFELYSYIEQNDFFNITGLNDQNFHFVNLSDSLNKENIANFLRVDNRDKDASFNIDNLKEWTEWIFKENAEGGTRLKGTSSDLKDLDLVLSNPKALKLFRSQEASLSQSVFLAEDAEYIVSISLDEALTHLIEADRALTKIDDFNKVGNFDDSILDIRKLAKKIFDYKQAQNLDFEDEL